MNDATRQRLVDAIQRQRAAAVAAELAGDDDLDTARSGRVALDACQRIGGALGTERDRLIDLLATRGIGADSPDARGGPAQRHTITIDVAAADAPLATEAIVADGFTRHPAWRGGAERSFWATADEVVLVRTASATTVVRIRWTARRRLPATIRPRPADWATVDLPWWASWAYVPLRPVRLVARRLGRRAGREARDHAALEPFLSTPTSLIEPLLDLAGVGPDDVVADIGCGDGRILIEAARRRGCLAVGAEYSASLIATARTEIAAAGLDDQVMVIHGDGLTLPLDEVSAALLFLPMRVATRVIPALLERLPAGARVVTHEQSPLPPSLPTPTITVPLIGDDALSVGHRWTVDR